MKTPMTQPDGNVTLTLEFRGRDAEAVEAAKQEGITVEAVARTGVLSFVGRLLNPDLFPPIRPTSSTE